MRAPTNQLVQALIARLKAHSDVAAYVGERIYTRVPKEAAFPYISLPGMESRSILADCIDLAEVTIQIDVWSRRPGFEELREIAEAVRDALAVDDLPLASHACVNLVHEQTQEMYDPDGITTHAALIFEAIIERI